MELDIKNLALPVYKLMARAIFQHLVSYQNTLPKRFVMHPAHLKTLNTELSNSELSLMFNLINFNKPTFQGVDIEVDVLADRLKLINSKNEVEYL